MSTDNDDLRWKIGEAKRRLPMPALFERLGLSQHAKKSAHCVFHDDEHKSFSVFKGEDGFWHYKCFAGCGEGDEILFLRKLKSLSMTEAMNCYLDMAGFATTRPPKSHEWLKSHEYRKSLGSPKYPESLVYPVSNGQDLDKGLARELERLGFNNACKECGTARKRRFQLARDLKAVEKRIGQPLSRAELILAFDEWHCFSQASLDPAKAREDYLAMFLGELRKVRVPTGEGDTLKKALEHVSKLSVSELPVIPDYAEAQERWRRIAALHRELSRRSTNKNKTYFLSCRDAAKAYPGFSHQTANEINLALEQLGVITIVRVGHKRLGGKASEFRYLLAQTENGASQTIPDSPQTKARPVVDNW